MQKLSTCKVLATFTEPLKSDILMDLGDAEGFCQGAVLLPQAPLTHALHPSRSRQSSPVPKKGLPSQREQDSSNSSIIATEQRWQWSGSRGGRCTEVLLAEEL